MQFGAVYFFSNALLSVKSDAHYLEGWDGRMAEYII